MTIIMHGSQTGSTCTKSCRACRGTGIDAMGNKCRGSFNPANVVLSHPNAATDKQKAFILKLIEEKGYSDPVDMDTMSKAKASNLIERLLEMRTVYVALKHQEAGTQFVTEGIWYTGAPVEKGGDGVQIWKVQRAHHGSGRLYTKKLILTKNWDIKIHGKRKGTFEYAPGGIKILQTEGTKMTLEKAKEFGALYGMCCVCSAILTDENSIAAGIGPVCASRF